MNEKITKDMMIADIIDKHPEAVDVFASYRMGCMGCMMARGENVEQAAAVHGIDADELVGKLNASVG
jgi:hybrid cluster-associated redox disulfide protein